MGMGFISLYSGRGLLWQSMGNRTWLHSCWMGDRVDLSGLGSR